VCEGPSTWGLRVTTADLRPRGTRRSRGQTIPCALALQGHRNNLRPKVIICGSSLRCGRSPPQQNAQFDAVGARYAHLSPRTRAGWSSHCLFTTTTSKTPLEQNPTYDCTAQSAGQRQSSVKVHRVFSPTHRHRSHLHDQVNFTGRALETMEES